MNKIILAALFGASFTSQVFAAPSADFKAYDYNLCKARGIAAVGVATDARDKREPVEATLNRLKPPSVMDVKLVVLADDYIKAGFSVSDERSLDALGNFLTGVCYQATFRAAQ